MNLHKRSRSIWFWLFIIILSYTTAHAQQSNDAGEVEKITANKTFPFTRQTRRFTASANKTDTVEKKNDATSEGQVADQNQTKGSNREFGIYAGSVAFYKDIKGPSQKAPVVLFGLRYAWTTKNNERHRLRYYMDFDPLIIVNYREKHLVQATPTTTTTVGNRRTVFGVGFMPLGLQFNWRNSRKYQPYIAGGFGIALFNRRFPDNRSALQPDKIGNFFQLNPEFGAGLEIRKSERKSYFIGYKYHHLSNGYTAPLNVGFNTNMIYAGMYFQRAK